MTQQPVTLAWYGCSLQTGAIAEELRALTPTQPLQRRLGASTSTAFGLALAGAPAAWEAATDPGRTLTVGVDTATGQIVWSGIPLPRAGGSAPTLDLAAVTPECYLDRRYPGSYSATSTDLATIVQQLATPILTQGPAITLDTTACGTLGNYTVADTDDKSILSCLQEIAAMDGAPEWTIDTVWANAAQTAVQLVLRIKPAIGVQSTNPEAVFDMPGCVTAYTLTESFERDKGATSVIARGAQTAAGRASSTTHLATAQLSSGWPLWETRFQPAAAITDQASLEAHAAAALALMATGSRAWTISAAASASPRLGQSWALGDSVRLRVTSSPRHPDGAETVARAYAWSLDAGADQVQPILLEGVQ
ncbi:hypothetical protein C7C46_09005 [Streptomyces tateyamensis]|uniref:Tip attachment protein J domain-containing protein n=1 Tax=Streptomyces tateyamensis TaxID=565073 RepID=A0A2V4PHL6_9ACTN|nr:hypothetical protein [Streptomyces tateyamensis]PYC83460.1 hypothetical protein C7C46_09005 [Streptomyces tateyamensis]